MFVKRLTIVVTRAVVVPADRRVSLDDLAALEEAFTATVRRVLGDGVLNEGQAEAWAVVTKAVEV